LVNGWTGAPSGRDLCSTAGWVEETADVDPYSVNCWKGDAVDGNSYSYTEPIGLIYRDSYLTIGWAGEWLDVFCSTIDKTRKPAGGDLFCTSGLAEEPIRGILVWPLFGQWCLPTGGELSNCSCCSIQLKN